MTPQELVKRVRDLVNAVRKDGIVDDLIVYVPHTINLFAAYNVMLNQTIRDRILTISQVVDVIYTEGKTLSLSWDKEAIKESKRGL